MIALPEHLSEPATEARLLGTVLMNGLPSYRDVAEHIPARGFWSERRHAILWFLIDACGRCDALPTPAHYDVWQRALATPITSLAAILDDPIPGECVADAWHSPSDDPLSWIVSLGSDTILRPNLARTAKHLAQLAHERRAASMLVRAAAACHKGAWPSEILGRLVEEGRVVLTEIDDDDHAARGMNDFVSAALDTSTTAAVAQWGIPTLDRDMPLVAGRTYVVGAAPGTGKTSIGLWAAMETACGNTPALLMSYEMDAVEMTRRALVSYYRQPLEAIAKHTRNPELPEALTFQAGRWTATELVTAARKAAQEGHRLIVVDYLQRVVPEGRQKDFEAIGAASVGLDSVARECDCAIIIASQLRREGRSSVRGRDGAVKAHKQPGIEDLKGSGSIEQDADAILMLWPAVENDERQTKPVLGCIAKNRHGSVSREPLRLALHGAYGTWSEAASDYGTPRLPQEPDARERRAIRARAEESEDLFA